MVFRVHIRPPQSSTRLYGYLEVVREAGGCDWIVMTVVHPKIHGAYNYEIRPLTSPLLYEQVEYILLYGFFLI